MLNWFVEESAVATALNGRLINEEEIEVRPEKLPDAVLDENVDIHQIRKYFSNDAWLVVMDVVQQKHQNPVFVCKCCYHNLDEGPSIVCDHCLSWSHISCVGLTKGTKQKYWYCYSCRQVPLNNEQSKVN